MKHAFCPKHEAFIPGIGAFPVELIDQDGTESWWLILDENGDTNYTLNSRGAVLGNGIGGTFVIEGATVKRV